MKISNNMTNFELIALSDCNLRNSEDFKSIFNSIIGTSKYVGIPGYILSTFTGFLILSYSK